MDLTNYTGLKVKIVLINNYFYIGQVISSDKNSLDLKDIKGHLVSLKAESILTIQEVSQ